MISYSFDIYEPSLLDDDQDNICPDAAITDTQNEKPVVVFRDQQTLDAVTSSPAVVRMFLEEVGFGFSLPAGTVPQGYALANNDDSQRALRKRVIKALSNQALEKALHRVGTDSAFDVRTFVQSIAQGSCGATPKTAPPPPETQPTETSSAAKPSAMPIKVVTPAEPRRPRPSAKPITVRPAAKPIQMPDGPSETIIPRRPSQLRGLGVKSRERPQ